MSQTHLLRFVRTSGVKVQTVPGLVPVPGSARGARTSVSIYLFTAITQHLFFIECQIMSTLVRQIDRVPNDFGLVSHFADAWRIYLHLSGKLNPRGWALWRIPLVVI